MDVGVKQQILAPGVEDRKESDLRSKMFGIGGDLRQSLSNRSEQQVVEFFRILPDQRVEQMGQREHDVEVTGGQQFLLPSFDPSLTRLRLALGAVAVPAGVVGEPPILSASQALIDMTTEERGPATHDSAHDLQLLETEPALMLLDESVAQRAEDIGHLHGGPAHFCRGR